MLSRRLIQLETMIFFTESEQDAGPRSDMLDTLNSRWAGMISKSSGFTQEEPIS
jgi:hypothetical protein